MGNFIENLKKHAVCPGYPALERRPKMDRAHYQRWVANGRNVGVAAKTSDLPEDAADAERMATEDGTERHTFHDVQFAPSVAGEYPRDAIGRPVHPYAEQILAAGLAAEGRGALRVYGPNRSVNAVVLGATTADRKLKTIVIKYRESGVVILPGGCCDFNEEPRSVALRGLKGATGVHIPAADYKEVERIHESIRPDSCTTLNAWPEVLADAIFLWGDVIDGYTLKEQDSNACAELRVVDSQLYFDLSALHREILYGAVRRYEELTYFQVSDNGSTI